jgi:hypothetical protein
MRNYPGPGLVAPPVTPVEAALFHFQHEAHRALHCRNRDCPAPYFFMTEKGQKFCCSECRRPARLEGQRRWWHENRSKSKRRKQK